MEEHARFHFDHQTRILYKSYFGTVNVLQITDSWKSFISEGRIPEKYQGIVIDYRGAHIDAELTGYLKILEFYKLNVEIFKKVRIAIVVQNPKDIVHTMLFENESDGFMIRNFSTIEAAEAWILS